ncbi:MAG: YraN family protein [Chloroflexota bacterium]|nr:YraN family protein [Chloroflexota bacterium]
MPLRRRLGDRAESLVAAELEALGWTVLAAGVHVGRDEIDLICVEPGPPPRLVFVEVRSRSSVRFGAPEETLDGAKIARIYRAAFALLRGGRLPDGRLLPRLPWRVDLVAVDARLFASQHSGEVQLRHIRGVAPD